MSNFASDRRIVSVHDEGPRPLLGSAALPGLEVFVWREATSAMIRWDVLPPSPTWLTEDHRFRVERASSPYGPFHVLRAGIDPTARQVRDDDVEQGRARSRFVFYRVGVYTGPDDYQVFGRDPQWDLLEQDPGGVTWDQAGVASHTAPGVNREIRARLNAVFRHFIGEPCLIYRPSYLAPLDRQKVDPVTGVLEGQWGEDGQSLGQPFLGGYDHPVFALCSGVGAEPIQVQMAAGRIVDAIEGASVEMLYWPPVQVDDILRFLNGTLLQVVSVQSSPHLGGANNHICGVSSVERSHPINSLPMPAQFRQRALAPRRGAGMCMNLESYEASTRAGAGSRMSILRPTTLPQEPSK